VPVKTIPDFLPMRRELYGTENSFLAGITPENLPEEAQISTHINDRGMAEARSAFQKLFLPFSYDGMDETACRDALFRIRIGDKAPFSAQTDVHAGIAAVMNHLSKRYVEAQRSGETVSILQENSVITFMEPEFAPPERPFWQSALPHVKKEREQLRSLQERNRNAETLCAQLTADLSKHLEHTETLRRQAEPIILQAAAKQILLSDPASVERNYAALQGSPLAERLKPQLEYYADPQHSSAEKAWESVQDGFAIEEYLETSRTDPCILTAEQLDVICVHPHVRDAEAAKRLMEVHIANAPKRLQMQQQKTRTVRRESVSLHEISGKETFNTTAVRSVSEKERQKNGPTK